MGAMCASLVYAYWPGLRPTEKGLLTFMALTARDTYPAKRDERGRPIPGTERVAYADFQPSYWGGWEDAAVAMGQDPYRNERSAHEMFRRSVRGLVAAGAVVSSGRARPGHRAEYALTLQPGMGAIATPSRDEHGRRVTQWAMVPREDPRPVDIRPAAPPEDNKSLPSNATDRGDDAQPIVAGRTTNRGGLGELTTTRTTPRKNIALEVTTRGAASLPASADVRGAAVFLARQHDQGRAALADMMANRGSLSESDVVLIAARMAGWAPEAEEVPA